MNWLRDKATISELFDQYNNYDLILQPFFQRNLVWTEKAKSHFIESILLGMPISEIFLSVVDDKYNVIDGQQRLSTIFHFLENKIKLQSLEKLDDFNGSYFSDIVQENFLAYEISIVKILEPIKEEVIDMYSRINKYTVNLNEQELRKAAFSDSAFLKLSEELSELDFFERIRIFTPRKRQRMQDVEFISELLCILFDGMQDKKHTLDSFYNRYTSIQNYQESKEYFQNIILKFEEIFGSQNMVDHYQTANLFGNEASLNLSQSRFKQLADFYSLYATIKDFFFVQRFLFDDTQKIQVSNILMLFDEFIEPEADIRILSEYAIKCVSQGNTLNSRRFRYQVLYSAFEFVRTQEMNPVIDSIQKDFQDIFNIEINLLDFNLDRILQTADEYYSSLDDGED